jgi:hypothetical protein
MVEEGSPITDRRPIFLQQGVADIRHAITGFEQTTFE